MVLEAIKLKFGKVKSDGLHDPNFPQNPLLPAPHDAIRDPAQDPLQGAPRASLHVSMNNVPVASSLPPHVKPSWMDRQGTWNGFPAHKLFATVDIGKLLVDYEKSWKTFQDDVTKRIPNDRLVAEVKERAEEERKELERRAEEERKCAEHAEEGIKELERHAEEERKRAEHAEEGRKDAELLQQAAFHRLFDD